MGYYVDGTFDISFLDQESIQAALKDIAKEENKELWVYNPNGQPTPPQNMIEAFCAIWETSLVTGPNTPETPLTYSGWVTEKWHDAHQAFATVVAPHVAHLYGNFRGEDSVAWTWSLRNGELHEDSLEDVPSETHARHLEADKLIQALVTRIIENDTKPENLIRDLKIGLLQTTYATAELVTVLAHDLDPEVSEASGNHLKSILQES